ncbi:hypothetical protein BS17DRAFT_761974 [Gyrodon lividus]|nr:hypothetical protein BS17DRAFT_761974 [Gyrodon lividus]
MLPELNPDVLFHIFSFLQPMDLLNLARTTKAFRQLLMRRSSVSVWKTARGGVEGLPDCPPDLSEPQYANLAFYSHCHNCGNFVPTIHWQLRRRYCSSCRKKCLQLRKYSGHLLRGGGLLPEEILKVTERIDFIYVDIEQLDAFMAEYYKVPVDKRDEFLADRRLHVCTIQEHASKCKAWHQDATDARNSERQNARIARADSIFARLKSLGYEAEINYYEASFIQELSRSIFNDTKPLTDKVWDRVYPQLEQQMVECRIRRLEQAVYNPRRRLLVELYDAYVQKPAPEGAVVDLLPSLVDLVHSAPFDTIIKLPEETNVNSETFKPAFEQIPALVQQWRADVEAQLAALVVIPAELSTSDVSKDDVRDQKLKPAERLRLASAVFQVRSTRDLMMYPDILHLPIFNDRYRPSSSFAYYAIKDQPWSLMDKGPVVKLLKGAAHVVRACGLDPQTATVEDMDERNARMTCNYCYYVKEVWTWRSAIRHLMRHSIKINKELKQWSLVDDCHVPNTQAVEQPPIKPCDDICDSSRVKVHCAICHKRVGDTLAVSDVRKHFLSIHNMYVDIPVEGDHFIGFEPRLYTLVERIVMRKDEDQVRFLHPIKVV